MIASLKSVIEYAQKNSTAIACVNVFGVEDAMAVKEASEKLNLPIILSAAKDLIEFTPLQTVAAFLRSTASQCSVPAVVHLDHCYDAEIIRQALDFGFTSVMFDGSQLPLSENIEKTHAVVEMARTYQANVEGEIGSVSYYRGRDHIKHELTDPESADFFYKKTGIDSMAVSVGNIHRLESSKASIDYELLKAIGEKTGAPLCIHGVSGLTDEDIHRLAVGAYVVKLNVGTLFRMEWGNRLREIMNAEPNEFDRIRFLKKLHPFIVNKIETFLLLLS